MREKRSASKIAERGVAESLDRSRFLGVICANERQEWGFGEGEFNVEHKVFFVK